MTQEAFMTDTKDDKSDKPKKNVDDIISKLLNNPPRAEESAEDDADKDAEKE